VAHSLSSKKRMRQNEHRRTLNRARRSTLRTKLRQCDEMFLHGNPADTEKAVREANQRLDRAGSQATLHRNAVARRKSRLARRLNAIKAKSASAT
jgi:small subunit ribosomal protein S20